jgi:hypothetical protein
LGTTSKLLAVGSNITSAITGTSTGALGGAGGGERMSSVSQGIMEGSKTFGEGLLKGVTGIVADPLAGAKSGGMLGLVKGVGKGLVGVPGQIIGGALSGISKVTEGLDASVREVSALAAGPGAPAPWHWQGTGKLCTQPCSSAKNDWAQGAQQMIPILS